MPAAKYSNDSTRKRLRRSIACHLASPGTCSDCPTDSPGRRCLGFKSRHPDHRSCRSVNPRPFQWIATADEILAKVQLVQASVKKPAANNSK